MLTRGPCRYLHHHRQPAARSFGQFEAIFPAVKLFESRLCVGQSETFTKQVVGA